VRWAHADRRVLLWADDGRLACHVGLFAQWPMQRRAAPACRPRRRDDEQVVGAGLRQPRHASCRGSVQADGADCGLLFCEAHIVDFYAKLGWHPFHGKVLAQQPQGRVAFARLNALVLDLKRAPRLGGLDVCGLP